MKLHAKPIVDILGGVDSLQDIDAKKSIFESLGYEFKGEYGISGRRYCLSAKSHQVILKFL